MRLGEVRSKEVEAAHHRFLEEALPSDDGCAVGLRLGASHQEISEAASIDVAPDRSSHRHHFTIPPLVEMQDERNMPYLNLEHIRHSQI